jgi:hypothetical protein
MDSDMLMYTDKEH